MVAAMYSGLNAFTENLISHAVTELRSHGITESRTLGITESRNQSFVRPFRCLDCFMKGQSKIQDECE